MAASMSETRADAWQVTASTVSYKDRWLTLRSDTCVTTAGVTIAPWHVLEYPDWVNLVAIDEQGRLVLVRQYRHGVGKVVLGLPCGACERSDGEDADERRAAAAGRELAEEAGYHAARLVPVLTSFPNAASHNNTVTSFLATGVELRGLPANDPTEIVDVVLEDIGTVLARVVDGTWRLQSMHVAALWSAVGWMLANPNAPGVTPATRARIAAVLGVG
jgi:8-oxo-dGTP pyrophosphatase MutT (NUDIX family)